MDSGLSDIQQYRPYRPREQGDIRRVTLQRRKQLVGLIANPKIALLRLSPGCLGWCWCLRSGGAGIRRVAILSACAALIALGLFGIAIRHSPVGASGDVVLLAQVEDTVTPATARYIARAVQQAGDANAGLLVIRMSPVDGVYRSAQAIAATLLEADIPVVVFVSPRGAQAGSAGTFIAAAAHIAAMSPGSSIGAAASVANRAPDTGDSRSDQVANEAAAFIRSIADARGRNPDALEQTVRTAASYTAREAWDAGIIDLIAADLPELLAALDGRTVATASGVHTLRVDNSDIRPVKLQWREKLVGLIANPNIAFLLISLGFLGLVFEMMTPGFIFPGVIGCLSMALGLYAAYHLSFNWVGAAFVVLAVALAALEIVLSDFRGLSIVAVVGLIVGGALLFGRFGGSDLPVGFPEMHVSPWLLAGVGCAYLLGAAYLTGEAIRSRVGARARLADSDGRSEPGHLIGQTGTVTTALQPQGIVSLGNETWSAVSGDGGEIPAGLRVRVVGVAGLLLTVAATDTAEAVAGTEQ